MVYFLRVYDLCNHQGGHKDRNDILICDYSERVQGGDRARETQGYWNEDLKEEIE